MPDQIRSSKPHQLMFDISSLLRLIPKEELPLGKFLTLSFSRKYRFQSIRVKAGVPRLCTYGHWSWCKILRLFQMKVQVFCLYSKLCHIFFLTSGMAAYKIRYNLLSHIQFLIYFVESLFEVIKLRKRRFPHDLQHWVAGVFRSHFQTPADMIGYQFAGIFIGTAIYCRVFTLMQ